MRTIVCLFVFFILAMALSVYFRFMSLTVPLDMLSNVELKVLPLNNGQHKNNLPGPRLEY